MKTVLNNVVVTGLPRAATVSKTPMKCGETFAKSGPEAEPLSSRKQAANLILVSKRNFCRGVELLILRG